ncbi:MAG: hypothetical protein ACPLXO_00965 [Desulfurella sp.]
MFGYIGRSLLVACGSLLIITIYSKADLFNYNNQTRQTHTANRNDVQSIINQQQNKEAQMQSKAQELINAGLKPKSVVDYQNLTVNQMDNAVLFYFTPKSFNQTNVVRAINLARQHNLYPVIYYLSEQCSFANASQVQQFFYQHGLQHIFTPNYSDNVSFELSCDGSVMQKLKNTDNVYFKFMSIRGFHGEGCLDDFEKIYRKCFTD